MKATTKKASAKKPAPKAVPSKKASLKKAPAKKLAAPQPLPEKLPAKAHGVVYKKLRAAHPDAHCELDFTSPLELLVATVLSAQCTDVRVNEVTKKLFKRCKRLKDYLTISQEELEQIVHSAGFFRQKAKNIRETARIISDEHGGEVPRTMDELVRLPGVGRKTANVILGNAFGIPGLPVDTHVGRVSRRIGLTIEDDPVKVERDLCESFPAREWTMLSHTLIFHGRRICAAKKPLCEKCPVADICRWRQNIEVYEKSITARP